MERVVRRRQLIVGRTDLERLVAPEQSRAELVLGAVVGTGVEVTGGTGLNAIATGLHIPEQRLAENDRRVLVAHEADEIDRLRHSATAALLTRRDVIIVASVSAIYGLGSPEQYEGQLLRLEGLVWTQLNGAVDEVAPQVVYAAEEELAHGGTRQNHEGEDRPFKAGGAVVRCDAEEAGGHLVAVFFTQMDASNSALLAEFIERQLEDPSVGLNDKRKSQPAK